jgi:type II secretory pathway component PulF
MRRPLATVDIVMLCLTGTFVMALFALRLFWIPSVARMFQDFSSTLPTSTRLVLHGGFAPGVAGIGAVACAVGAWRRRTGLLVGAAVFVGVAIGFVFWGMYAPIFELAGNIEP